MNKDILNTAILSGSFLVLFGIAEILYHKFNVKVELTRKFVHIGTGLLTLLFPILLGNFWLVLLLCSTYAVILLLSLKFNFLKSINAIERKSAGSIAYPISVSACYLVFDYFHQQYIYFYLPILILAICDPVAALTGKRWPIGKYKIGRGNKTMMGSGMFFLSAFILSFIGYGATLGGGSIFVAALCSVIIGASTSAAEAVSGKGLDNITVPAVTILAIIFLHLVILPHF